MKIKFPLRIIIVFVSILFPLIYGCTTTIHGEKPETFAKLEVVTYNIGDLNGRRPDTSEVVAVIKRNSSPDIILLQEVHSEEQAKLISNSLGMPYTTFHSAKDKMSGLAILSRYPIKEGKFNAFKSSNNGFGFISAQVMIDGRIILVTSVRLERIRSINSNRDRIEISWLDGIRYLIKEMTEIYEIS